MSATAKAWVPALRAHLDANLFPATPPAPRNGRGGRMTMVAAFLLIAATLELLRPGWEASMHSIWAEDGSIYLHGGLTRSFGETVFAPYANYLVLVPRLIGDAATLVPLRNAPAAISILSAVAISLSGLVVWYATAGHIESRWLRGTLAVLTVLVPVGGLESLDSAAYVPWYMLFATFWILLWRPATRSGAVLAALFVLATALSTPGVWFFIPIAVLRALAIRDRRDGLIVGAFTVGALAQIPVLASNHEQIYHPTWTSDIPTAYLQRVVDGAVFGQRLGGFGWAHLGWPFLAALMLASAAALAAGFWRSNLRVRYVVAITTIQSLALFGISLYQRAVGSEMVWPAGAYNGAGGRYVIIPALLLVSAAALIADGLGRRGRPPGRKRWPELALCALMLLSVITSFDMAAQTVRGKPTWEDSLGAAAHSCIAEQKPEAAVPVAPTGVGFQVALPCSRISSFAGG